MNFKLNTKLKDLAEYVMRETNILKKIMNDIHDIEQIVGFIEGELKEWRNDTRLVKTSEVICINRIHTRTLERVFMIPTNLNSISWLDLVESSVDCDDAIDKYHEFNELSIEHRLQDDDEKVFNKFADAYVRYVHNTMQLEHMFNVALTLCQNWDAERFVRYTAHCSKKSELCQDFHFKVFPRLLLDCCADSVIIAHYFIMLCSVLFQVEVVLEKMNPVYIYFFMLHITNRLRTHPEPEEFEMRVTNLRLVEKAFLMGQIDILNLLLKHGWPNECLRYCDGRFSMNLNWPRRTEDSLNVTSSNSSSLTANFIWFLISHALSSEAPNEVLVECIRLFWRTVPVPYVSVSDLEHLFYTIHNLHQQEVDIHEECTKFITSVLAVFPSDCIATYQPRSLLHLSRCKVRELLDMTRNVSNLPIPHTLKDYLHLKW